MYYYFYIFPLYKDSVGHLLRPAGDIINVDALTPSQLALIIASFGCAITWFCEEFQHRRRKPAETTVAQLVNGDIERCLEFSLDRAFLN
jgi:hypothetical protein